MSERIVTGCPAGHIDTPFFDGVGVAELDHLPGLDDVRLTDALVITE